LAVVVQQLIVPDAAGVCFTKNPVTGADERYVSASWGFGEAVVDGSVVPDNLRVAPGGKLLDYVMGTKTSEVTYGTDGRAIHKPISAARGNRRCLGEREVRALDEVAARCQEACGADVDFEWAFESGQLYVLQCRPITTKI